MVLHLFTAGQKEKAELISLLTCEPKHSNIIWITKSSCMSGLSEFKLVEVK